MIGGVKGTGGAGKESSILIAQQVIEGIIALQDKIFHQEKWLGDEIAKSKGNVARMQISSLDGSYSKTFELGDDMVIRESKKPPKHVISCHIDLLLDLMAGDISMGDAYVKGLITFDGEDFHAHAWKWSRYFSRIQRYLGAIKV